MLNDKTANHAITKGVSPSDTTVVNSYELCINRTEHSRLHTPEKKETVSPSEAQVTIGLSLCER
jgi:hypothetical protein